MAKYSERQGSRPDSRPRLAVSTGDPAGIGPDVSLQALELGSAKADLVLLGDRDLLGARAKCLGLSAPLASFDPAKSDSLSCLHVPTSVKAKPGQPDPANVDYVLDLLRQGHELVAGGFCAGLVTAPLSKSAVAVAEPDFRGHTSYLARLCNVASVVMAFIGPRLRVALATDHLALAEVPAAITQERILDVLLLADRPLRRLLGQAPQWLVCGLNPHAGEDGLLGSEDREAIAPALLEARLRGLDVTGPVPADTAFLPAMTTPARCVLAMYHDQALPVVKRDSFTDTVNVTLGLPYVRTSPDHGTAFSLAGTGRSDCSSMVAAIALAKRLVGAVQGADTGGGN